MAGTSWVSICNAALIALGEDPIMSLDENNSAARACKWRYEAVRDAVLRMHPWACAKCFQQLQMEADAPTMSWEYKFQLPTDPYCLFVRQLWGDTDRTTKLEYELAGREIYTNYDTAYLEYTGRITDPNQLDPLLAETISAFLAAEIAEKLTGSTTKRNEMFKLAMTKLVLAQQRDGLERSYEVPAINTSDSSWLSARS